MKDIETYIENYNPEEVIGKLRYNKNGTINKKKAKEILLGQYRKYAFNQVLYVVTKYDDILDKRDLTEEEIKNIRILFKLSENLYLFQIS
jgi:hypothetical protein